MGSKRGRALARHGTAFATECEGGVLFFAHRPHIFEECPFVFFFDLWHEITALRCERYEVGLFDESLGFGLGT